MKRYYFYEGLLKEGKFFSIQGNRVLDFRKEKKIKKGEQYCFQDDSKKRYSCSVEEVKSRFLKFCVQKKVAELNQKDYLVHLYLPLLSRQEMEWLIFKATEMEVAAFHFFESKLSLKLFQEKKREKMLFHWKKICQQACENSGNPFLPEIFFCDSLESALQKLHSAKIPYYLLHSQKKKQEVFPSCKEVAFFIAPKKGFLKEEIEKMACPQISLGEHWLKPATAALSILAIFQYLFQSYSLEEK